MSLTGTLKVYANTKLISSLDTGSAESNENMSWAQTLATGTGAGQGNQVWSDTRTLGIGANEELDLSGSLTNGLGATVALARVIGLIVTAAAANGSTITVGGSAANGFDTWVATTGDGVKVRPGGFLAVGCSDATAYAVAAGTGDLLKITNDDGAASASYTIMLIGSE